MIYQPADISPDEANGSGTVDLKKSLTISWQPMGDSPMTAYQIKFYKMNAASTEIYDTEKQTLSSGFYGVDSMGNPRRFAMVIDSSILDMAGMTNGNEYKFLITCWSGSESVTQTAASVIKGRTTPVLSLSNLPSPLTARSYTFTAAHTQAEGDGLRTVRWRLAVKGSESEPFYDSGEIRTPLLSCTYDGFVPGTDYRIRLNTVSSSGATADTGWRSFSCSYDVQDPSGALLVLLTAEGGVLLVWTEVSGATGYTLMRKEKDSAVMQNLGSVKNTVTSARDYTACAGKTYIWYVYPEGSTAFLNKPMVSDALAVKYHSWLIVEAYLSGKQIGTEATSTSTNKTIYTAEKIHRFYSGITDGKVSNNNSPELLKNFTSYPTRLKSGTNYRTGSLTAIIGDHFDGSMAGLKKLRSFGSATAEGIQAIAEAELMALSRSERELFLLDPSGHCMHVATGGPVTVYTDHSGSLIRNLTLPWVETGSTEGLSVIGIEE